jgi:outer membrane protein assembly factor BamB
MSHYLSPVKLRKKNTWNERTLHFMTTIFCPTCSTLILDAAACAACGWQRPLEIGDAGKEVWRAELGRALPKPQCSAVIAGERYCLSAEDSTIVALDLASGQVAWERQIGSGHATHTLATDGARLFVSSVDTQPIPTNGKALLALDAATGQDIWRYATIGHSLSAAALAHAVAYFTSSDGVLHAVDAASGQARWQVRHASWGPEAPAADANLVYAGGRGDALVAYAIGDGAERWRFSAAAWFANPLCLAEGQLYTLNWDGFLYALEARTGRLLWKVKGERGQGFTSPPAANSRRLYVGSRVYHQHDGARADAYALLALRKEDGGEDWRFLTPKHIVAPPTVAGDSVLFGAEDGFFYALDADTGVERCKIAINGRIVTQPQIATDAAYIGERHGAVYAIRWRAEQRTHLQAPEAYLRQGELEIAAQAFALRGEFNAAAAIFDKELGCPREAALLWEALGELRRARDLYQAAGERSGVARMLAALGQPLHAAKLYEEIGDPAAAALYEEAGDRIRAAEIYRKLGRFGQAAAIAASLGDWERLVADLVAAGKPASAAQVLAQQGQIERAADLYESAGDLRAALPLRTKQEHWERVADLATQLEDYEQAAVAHKQLGSLLQAAEAYDRAAQLRLSASPLDEEGAATYYEQIVRLYVMLFDEERADAYRRKVGRYRHLPAITVSGGAQQAFVEYEWNILKLRVRNAGYGPATNVTTTLRGAFDTDGNLAIARLGPKKSAVLEVSLRPQSKQYGPAVPLEISVTYEDVKGGQYSVKQRIPIRVMPQGSAPESTTPLEIDITAKQLPITAAQPLDINSRQESIDQQETLLITYRRTLEHLVRQAAQYGGEAFVPTHVANSLYEARENIQRIKQVLHGWGIAVADHPNDRSES